MRGIAVKFVNSFVNLAWDRTPEEERTGTKVNFRRKCKREYKRNPKFRDYVKKFGVSDK
jgi:hypothetical protein